MYVAYILNYTISLPRKKLVERRKINDGYLMNSIFVSRCERGNLVTSFLQDRRRNGLKCFTKTSHISSGRKQELSFLHSSSRSWNTTVLGRKVAGSNINLVIPCEKKNDVVIRYFMLRATQLINSKARRIQVMQRHAFRKYQFVQTL
ncbi:uncharacterized protein LOC131070823 [Cryptomeria japonica]|uniref:uncharacterized protein LOC131070823 n=1 Tax=Cryptomeria japonica TaxID=3369 RepID=UPI0027D9F127|nr:uncharacterized protein LOC131070823 [Cryptomeria japonica]